MRDPWERDGVFNFSRAEILLVENSQHAVGLLSQILKGFGALAIHRCLSLGAAQALLDTRTIDLVMTEAELNDGDACAFVRALRTSSSSNNCVPIILTRGHVRLADVHKTRDIGVNYVIAKPVTAQIVLERLLWVLQDKRPFVRSGGYVGPDRRFKIEGPPPGSGGRRAEDRAPAQPVAGAEMPKQEVAA